MNQGQYQGLIFSDLRQCAVILRNSLIHDRRLAGYLGAAPGVRRDDLTPISESLRTLDRAIGNVIDECGEAARQATATPDGLAFRAFVETRSRIGFRMKETMVRAGNVYHALLARSEASPPDMTLSWTRLETSDGHAFEAVSALVQDGADRMSAWTCQGEDAAPPKVRLVMDHAYIPAPQARRDDWIDGGSEFSFYLMVPFWILYSVRYVPVLLHEAAHPFVRALTTHGGRYAGFRVQVEGRMVDILNRFHRPGRPQRDWRPVCQTLFGELMTDAAALRLGGADYLSALALYVSGSTPFDGFETRTHTVPLHLRLMVLHRLLVRWKGPSVHPVMSQGLTSAIMSSCERYEAEMLGGPDGEAGRRWLDCLAALERAIEPALAQIVDWLGEPPPSSPSAARGWASLSEAWLRAHELALDGGEAWRSLQSETEGRGLFLALRGQAVTTSMLELGEPWELVAGFVRPLPEAREVLSADVDVFAAQLARTSFPVGGHRVGWAGVVLGPCDIVVLRSGLRVRAPDDLPLEPVPGLATYQRRRILLEITRAPGFVGWRPGAGRGPSAFTEVRLSPEATIEQLVEILVSGGPGRGIEPLQIFVGTGWNDAVVVWHFASGEGLMEVHALLTRHGGVVERSITHLVCPAVVHQGVDHQYVPSWRPEAPATWSRPLELHASVRVAHAGDMHGLEDWLASCAVGAGAEVWVEHLFGMHDSFVRFTLRGDADVHRAARVLWSGLVDGRLSRSVAHLVFPRGDRP